MADRPTVLFHAASPTQARAYRETGRILRPVRGFTTLQAAMAWAMKVSRSVVYEVTADAAAFHKLPDHHNDFGQAWWIDADVSEFRCAFSAAQA